MLEPVKELHPAVLYFVQKPCTESWTISRSLIPFYDLTFILSGSAEYFINDVPYRIRAGEAVFVPCGAARSARTQGMRCAAFNFTLPPGESLSLGPVIPFSGVRPSHLLLTVYSREWILSGQS